MTAPSTTDIDFDPFAPRPFEELPPLWAELRDRAPVYRTAADMYVVTRYDDVRSIQRSPGLFSNRPQADEASNFPTGADADPEQLEMLRALMAGFPSEASIEDLTSARTIIAADPPDHTRIRRIVNRGFTPGRMVALGPKIDMIVGECLSGIETADGYDVVSRLAIPLPVQVIGDMLGIEPEMRPKIKYWTDGIAQSSVGDLRGTTEGLALGMRMLREFSAYLAPLVEQRRVHPQDDIISAMVRSMDDDTLSTAEALMMAVTIMAAGNETTTNLIGNAVVAFYENPDQLELLKADPSLLPNAVEACAIAGTDDVAEAARRLAERTGTVLVKCGRDGVLAAAGGRVVRAPAVAVDVCDTIGAGDSTNAGWLAGVLSGWPVERAAALAAACGSLSTRGRGGTAAQPTMVEALARL